MSITHTLSVLKISVSRRLRVLKKFKTTNKYMRNTTENCKIGVSSKNVSRLFCLERAVEQSIIKRRMH